MKPMNFRTLLLAGALALPFAAVADSMKDGPMGGGRLPMMHGGGMPPMGMDHMGGSMGMPPYLRHLDLTDSQQDKVFELMHAQAPAMRAKSRAVARTMEDLRLLAAADRFDPGKARTLADAHGRAVADMALMHAETEQKIRALLTPEQRKAMDDRSVRQEGHHRGPRH